MIFRTISLLILILAASLQIRGQHIIYDRADSLIFDTYRKEFIQKAGEPSGELIISTARFFIGKPYTASTLEIGSQENLVVNLREFDCTTLVESCIALSATISSEDTSFRDYQSILSSLRYRKGKIEGYTSRLHYTSDWIYENEQQGILRNISKELGGIAMSREINFMSSHPEAYAQLKNDAVNLNRIKEIEKHINDRNNYIVIPKASIRDHEKDIKDGDIIAFATSIEGLDYSHIGIACWKNGKLHFIHASSKAKKVIVEPKTLAAYCQSSGRCTGISVLRINEL